MKLMKILISILLFTICKPKLKVALLMLPKLNFQFNDGNGVRLRYDPLSSEMVEGKMVLKILKPPRNKDSLGSLTGQSLSWVFNVRNL